MSRLPLALAALLLAGCPPARRVTQSDTDGAQQAADDLAVALSKGAFGACAPSGGNQEDLDAVVGGMGGVGREGDRRGRLGRRGRRDGKAHLDLGDTGGAVDVRHRGRPRRRRRRVDRGLGAVGRRAVARPRASRSTPPRCRPDAATSSAPATSRWSRDGRWSASASTRPRCRPPVPSPRPGSSAALLDIDAAAYAKLVKAAGPKAFVEALVLREADGRPVATRRSARIQGARRARWRDAAGADPGVRGPDPRPGRPGHRRDREEVRGRGPARGRGRPVRPPGAGTTSSSPAPRGSWSPRSAARRTPTTGCSAPTRRTASPCAPPSTRACRPWPRRR